MPRGCRHMTHGHFLAPWGRPLALVTAGQASDHPRNYPNHQSEAQQHKLQRPDASSSQTELGSWAPHRCSRRQARLHSPHLVTPALPLRQAQGSQPQSLQQHLGSLQTTLSQQGIS